MESLAADAEKNRVLALAAKWGCDDADAIIYAERVGCSLSRDGEIWMATAPGFVNLQESPAGFGPTRLEAMAALCNQLGYGPSKMWGSTFADLLKRHSKAPNPS